MDRFEKVRAAIEAMFDQTKEAMPVTDRLLECAHRGVDTPESLSFTEIQQVCYALIVCISDF